MPIRKAGRWVVTVSLDHDALKVYQGFTKGQKSAKVCSALVLYNCHQGMNRANATEHKLRNNMLLRVEKALKVANYRIECIQRGDSDPGDAPSVYLQVLAEEETRSIRGGRF
jgi:hypothetical protein